MIAYFHKFIPKIALVLKPLYNLISSAKFKNTKIKWTIETDKSFLDAKYALSEATLLAHPQTNAHLSITTDSSEIGAAGVLEQTCDGITEPIAFFSKAYNSAQQKYSTFSRELLAIYLGVKQ